MAEQTTQIDETCRACGERVLLVMYGMPDPAAMEAAERGEFLLGGCMIEEVDRSCPCGATAYDEAGRRVSSFDVDDARAYIDEVFWKFASTMPQWPHEYTVLRWRPEYEETFRAFVALIRTDGVVKPWPADVPNPRYRHTYLAIDGWDYWTMGEPVDEVELINRARLTREWR
jgi:hypothetical protein